MTRFIPDNNHIEFAACNEINQICLPLKKYFGINYFCYQRYYWNLKRFSLSNHRQVVEYYYQNQCYNITNGVPDLRRGGIYFMDDFNTDNEFGEKIINAYRQRFNISHLITTIKHHVGHTEIITFGVPEHYSEFNRDFLFYQSYFNKFLIYFKDRAHPLIKQAKQDWLDLPQVATDFIKGRNEKLARKLSINSNEISVRRYYLGDQYGDIYITSKEMKCLVLFCQGYNYKKVARELGISQHTVQLHFNNIRRKLNCEGKLALLDKIKKTSLYQSIEQQIEENKCLVSERELIDSYRKQMNFNEARGTEQQHS